ncbi:MAG: hypothetical protein KKG59_06070 [Nanoarchaeota archaeon]|nr:hypothetical protein [Nanoarchaeota archaeon]
MIKRYKRPDMKNALSILTAAKSDMEYTLTMRINEASASTIVRNVYECFRMLGDALLISKGEESIDHYMPIKVLTMLHIKTSRPVRVIENLRGLRHNINYYGYKPRVEEADEVISIAKVLFLPLYRKIKKDVSEGISNKIY